MKALTAKVAAMRDDPKLYWFGVAAIAIVLAVLPFALASIGTAWVRITNLAILFVFLSLGLNIVVGVAGLLDLGYIGDLTDVCRSGWLAGLVEARCASDGHFILFGSNYQDVFAFIVLILVRVLRPSGLLGERVGDRA